MVHNDHATDPQRARRAEAISIALAGMREATRGSDAPGRAAAARISELLLSLAKQRELWHPALFPIAADRRWAVYELSEDPNGQFALYMSAARPGHAQPPHNHTTWAAIAGISGIEANHLFERTDPPIVPGGARLKALRTQWLGADEVMFLGPEDIHSIEVTEGAPALHLHVYGRGFRTLDRRVRFDLTSGQCDYFPVFNDIPRFHS